VQFQEKRAIGNCEEKVLFKDNFLFKKCIKLNWNFQRGEGVQIKK